MPAYELSAPDFEIIDAALLLLMRKKDAERSGKPPYYHQVEDLRIKFDHAESGMLEIPE